MDRELLLLQAKNELAEALLRCEKMQSVAGRKSVIADLPTTIKFQITESQEALTHAKNIVDRCTAVPGGLLCLAAALTFYDGASYGYLKAIRVALSIAILHTLTDEVEITDAQLTTFFNNSRPWGMKIGRPQSTKGSSSINTKEQIGLLWEMKTQSHERSSIIQYLDKIADAVSSEDSKNELVDWRKWMLDSHHLKLQAGQPSQEVELRGPYKPFLTIIVQSLSSKSTVYDVSAQLWRVQYSDPIQLPVRAKVYDLSTQLPSIVIQAIDSASDYLGESFTDLIIEFYLPDELISEEVDRLPRPDDPRSWFGMDYPIVVRPLYRLLDSLPGSGERRRLWQKRWHQIQKRMETNNPAEAKILICSLLEDDYDQAVIQLRNYSQLICYLGIPSPLNRDEAMQHQVLQLALDRGVPVVAWARRSSRFTDMKQSQCFVSTLLCDEHTSRLPWQLKDLRLEYHAQESHPSNHVTLLWDDADRIPSPWNAGPLTPPQESEDSL